MRKVAESEASSSMPRSHQHVKPSRKSHASTCVDFSAVVLLLGGGWWMDE